MTFQEARRRRELERRNLLALGSDRARRELFFSPDCPPATYSVVGVHAPELEDTVFLVGFGDPRDQDLVDRGVALLWRQRVAARELRRARSESR